MLLLGLLALAAAGFVALGVWQLERRVWKLDLIAQVDARVHAAAVAPPGPSEWPQVSAARDQYRRVQLRGVLTVYWPEIVSVRPFVAPRMTFPVSVMSKSCSMCEL